MIKTLHARYFIDKHTCFGRCRENQDTVKSPNEYSKNIIFRAGSQFNNFWYRKKEFNKTVLIITPTLQRESKNVGNNLKSDAEQNQLVVH